VDPGDRSLRDLADLLEQAGSPSERTQLINALEHDSRAGARKLAERARKQDDQARRREARWRAFCDPERRLRDKGYTRVTGVDEAGRGPLAGPVYAAAVILPDGFVHHPLDDSKRMTPSARQMAYRAILSAATAHGTGVATVDEIDRYNILGAVHLAVRRALEAIDPPAEFALVDGRPLTSCPIPHQALVKGDSRSRVIAAASVIAKVERDGRMMELDREYPGYGFGRNKGYGTEEHRLAIERLGPSPIHRRSFLRSGEQVELIPTPAGESSHDWGLRAEELVASDYVDRGYRIEHRRWRGGGGEIDLVCRRDDELIIVEIKAARGISAGPPAGWLDSRQRKRLRSAATELLGRMREESGRLSVRFDLVGVIETGSGPPNMTRMEGIEM